MGRSFTAELGKQVCTYKLYLIFGVSLALVLIAFSLVSLTVVEPASATYVIVVLNLATLAVLTVVMSIAIVICTRRDY
ncbi:hypothetical protein ACFQO4_01015 [Saliphagus sp. GCM10025334]